MNIPIIIVVISYFTVVIAVYMLVFQLIHIKSTKSREVTIKNNK